MVQMLHVCGDHWVIVSNLLCPENEIRLYNTVYSDIDQPTKALLIEMFNEGVRVTVDGQLQKQKGDRDCGVFNIAVTTSLLHNLVSGPFVWSLLRPHFIHCLENKLMMPFLLEHNMLYNTIKCFKACRLKTLCIYICYMIASLTSLYSLNPRNAYMFKTICNYTWVPFKIVMLINHPLGTDRLDYT